MAGAGQVPDQATFGNILLELEFAPSLSARLICCNPGRTIRRPASIAPPRYCCTAGTKDRRFGFPHRAGLAAQQVMSRGERPIAYWRHVVAGCAFERYHYERAMTRARGD